MGVRNRNVDRRFLTILLGLLGTAISGIISIAPAGAQSLSASAEDTAHVHATLRLTSGRAQYRQGELIQVELQLTTDEPDRFEVSAQIGNRWNPIVTEQFHVTPSQGVTDPLAAYENPFLSNERRFSLVPGLFSSWPGAWPATITLPLTDWLRFDRPGHYKLSVRTLRVSGLPATPAGPHRALAFETNEVEFDIVAADDVWRAQQLQEIAAQSSFDWPRLRALGTADAARFLARHYRGEIQPLDHEALLGLLGSPNQQAGVDEMRHLLGDPDYPVTPSFLQAMAILDTPAPEATWPSIRVRLSRLRDQLARALLTKRGQALVTSRQTYMAGLEQLAAVKFGSDQIGQIIQTFEQLPPIDQGLWLGQRWSQVSDPSWLPLLKRLASREVNFRQPGNPDLDPVVGISELALKRWYEIDPGSAREAILREITSPAPRFGADALGILPDRTLPAEQHIIAEHFASLAPPAPIVPSPADRRPGTTRQASISAYQAAESHLASLLFRYADRDVVPQILPAAKNRLAERNCDAQDNVAAFLLNVDPDQAGSFIRSMTAHRPGGYTGCEVVMYGRIGSLIASPVLERLAIETLNDVDLQVATEALRYLRDHGSAQAEQPVYDRLVLWNTKWRDHASDLVTVSGRTDRNDGERSFGMELAQTLARGHGWLADEARIRQVLALTLEPGARMDLTAALSQLEGQSIHIYFMSSSSPTMFLVAQYQLDSLDDLKRKLSQYPRDTVFVWSDHRSATYEILDHAMSRDIAQWSSEKGIHIEGL